MKTKISDTNHELIEMKAKHQEEIQQYILRLKNNDKIIQDRINLFDKDMLELQSKLVVIKDGLTKTMESQLEQEKIKMNMNNED